MQYLEYIPKISFYLKLKSNQTSCLLSDNPAHKWHLAMSRNVFGLFQLEEEVLLASKWDEAKDAAKYPQDSRVHNEESSGPKCQ